MISIRACFAMIPVAVIIVACGGSSTTVGDIPSDGGTGADGTTGDDSATGTDTGSGADTSTMGDGDAGPDTSFIGDSALTLDGNDGGGCPNVLGGYSLLVVTGLGCGNFNADAQQCIQMVTNGGNTNACLVRFRSEQPSTVPAINGPNSGVDIQADGSFDNAALQEGNGGSSMRTGCTGTWTQATQTRTVTCGGTGTSQSCTVTMVRSSLTCP